MLTAALAVPSLASGGNRVTALRWARRLRELGWRTFVEEGWSGRPADLLIALHARKCGEAIEAWRADRPARPLVVAGTGTDLYKDLVPTSEHRAATSRGFEAADRIILLQERAAQQLPANLRSKARVIHQSLAIAGELPPKHPTEFVACVMANMRDVKDPLLSAQAVRLLPAESAIRVQHLGSAPDPGWLERIRQNEGPRWSWLGVRPRREALCLLAASHLCIVSSRAEGGANAVTEALALDVPLLATDIPGNTGLVGSAHPGLFPVGDATALARLMQRAEQERAFYEALVASGRTQAWRADPNRERQAWRELLGELFLELEPVR